MNTNSYTVSDSPSLSKVVRVRPAHFLCNQPWQLPSQNTASSPTQWLSASRIGSLQIRQSALLILPPLAFRFGGDVAWSFLLGIQLADMVLYDLKWCPPRLTIAIDSILQSSILLHLAHRKPFLLPHPPACPALPPYLHTDSVVTSSAMDSPLGSFTTSPVTVSNLSQLVLLPFLFILVQQVLHFYLLWHLSQSIPSQPHCCHKY